MMNYLDPSRYIRKRESDYRASYTVSYFNGRLVVLDEKLRRVAAPRPWYNRLAIRIKWIISRRGA